MRPAVRRTPRKKPTQKRAQDTVDAMLVAAARILVRDGYERTNVNRVAELAGVSVGSLYQYFPTKDALVAEVARRLSNEMLAAFEQGLGADVALLPLREAARGVVASSVRAFRVNPALRAAILRELPPTVFDSAEFDAMFAEALRGYFAFHAEKLRPKNFDLAAAILVSSVEASCTATALRGDREEEVIDELTQLVCGYLERR